MRTAVAIQRTPKDGTVAEVKEALQACLASLGGLESVVRPGCTVLLKPNAGVVAPPESARNTDPRLVEGFILLLKELGAGRIYVAEASIVGVDTMEVLEASGILEAAQRTGAEIVDLKSQPFKKLEVSEGIL